MVGPLLEQLGVHLVVGHNEHEPHLEHGTPDGAPDDGARAESGIAGDALRCGELEGGGGADAQRARHREGDAETAPAWPKERSGGGSDSWRGEGQRAEGTIYFQLKP